MSDDPDALTLWQTAEAELPRDATALSGAGWELLTAVGEGMERLNEDILAELEALLERRIELERLHQRAELARRRLREYTAAAAQAAGINPAGHERGDNPKE